MAEFITRLRKIIDTMTQLLHLVGLVKQMAAFHKPENHATTELQEPGGVSSPFSTPDMIKFAHFTVVTLKEVDASRCLPSIKENLTLKLMDNLISQSSIGGKSSFCESELAILQVSVHASLKACTAVR